MCVFLAIQYKEELKQCSSNCVCVHTCIYTVSLYVSSTATEGGGGGKTGRTEEKRARENIPTGETLTSNLWPYYFSVSLTSAIFLSLTPLHVTSLPPSPLPY